MRILPLIFLALFLIVVGTIGLAYAFLSESYGAIFLFAGVLLIAGLGWLYEELDE
jgi:hypothetical protein